MGVAGGDGGGVLETLTLEFDMIGRGRTFF